MNLNFWDVLIHHIVYSVLKGFDKLLILIYKLIYLIIRTGKNNM